MRYDVIFGRGKHRVEVDTVALGVAAWERYRDQTNEDMGPGDQGERFGFPCAFIVDRETGMVQAISYNGWLVEAAILRKG